MGIARQQLLTGEPVALIHDPQALLQNRWNEEDRLAAVQEQVAHCLVILATDRTDARGPEDLAGSALRLDPREPVGRPTLDPAGKK